MIEKKLSPKGRSVRVTFKLPADLAENQVAILGDFNEWSADTHVMKFVKSKGVWSKSISFKPGTTHQFKYLIDGRVWRNDEEADGYARNDFFSENGVLEV